VQTSNLENTDNLEVISRADKIDKRDRLSLARRQGGPGMDPLAKLFDDLKAGETRGHLRGMLHVLIGRKIHDKDGNLICAGLTWRQTAAWLRKVRWDPHQVKELDLDPDALPPRDRQRYWYTAIAAAKVDAPEAEKAGHRFLSVLKKLGYMVAPTAAPKNS
jgi:hypothetical protein